jgi:hypothetical protein
VPAIDLVDDTFVVASPRRVADVVADPGRWVLWWPDLRLTRTRDRGLKGQQWRVDGPLAGTAEIWLEPWGDGVLVHWYLRCDAVDRGGAGAGAPGRVDRERRRRAQDWKRVVHALKDELEAGREPGTGALKAVGAAADDTADGDLSR